MGGRVQRFTEGKKPTLISPTYYNNTRGETNQGKGYAARQKTKKGKNTTNRKTTIRSVQ